MFLLHRPHQVQYEHKSVEITALPVLYSGSVSSLTLLQFCGAKALTDSEAPFTFAPECTDYVSGTDGDQPTFTAGGNAIGTKGGKVYLDFKAPAAPHFKPNPNGREDGWINQAVLVATAAGANSSRNKDGWLTYNDDDKTGVGGYSPRLRYSTTTPSIVDGARAATPNVPPTDPTKKDAACVVATAVDLLGNESKLPAAGKACAAAAGYKTALDALKTANEGTSQEAKDDALAAIPAGLRGGLDVSAPTIAFSTASPKANASSLKNFQVQVSDTGGATGKSGLDSDPVLAKIVVRNAKNDLICGDQKDVGGPVGEEKITGECVLAATGIDFNDPLATTKGLGSSTKTNGYYTFTAVSQDKAGNRSEEVMRTAVNDGTAPTVGLIVGGYAKGAWSLTATLTDNLSVKQYWAEARDDIGGLTGAIILPREGSTAVDAYNAPTLTQSHLTSFTMMNYRALQTASIDAVPGTIDSILVVGTDHSGKSHRVGVAGTALGATTTLARFGTDAGALGTGGRDAAQQSENQNAAAATQWNDNQNTEGTSIRFKRDEVFQDFIVIDDESDADVVELRATLRGTAGYKKAVAEVTGDNPATDATETDFVLTAEVRGTEGLVNNPASRVDFYAAVDLKSTGSGDGTDRVPPVPDGAGTDNDPVDALVFLGSSECCRR